ncbi:MAG: hypothetical protein J6Q76_02710 [Clostridia bacterium]|nr:hypothetical protein [Clostridia bacterium]
MLKDSYTHDGTFTATLLYGTGFYPNGQRVEVDVMPFYAPDLQNEELVKVESRTSGTVTKDCYVMQTDSEWVTFQQDVKVPAATLQEMKDTHGVNNINLYFSIKCYKQSNHLKDAYVYIDDICVRELDAEGTVYNYNFVDDKTGTTNYTREAGLGNELSFGEGDTDKNIVHIETLLNKDINGDGTVASGNKDLASYVVTKDMIDGVSLAGDGSSLVHDGQTVPGGAYLGAGNATAFTTEGEWSHYRMHIKDPDINNGNWLTIGSGKKYAITVKFKAGNGIKDGDKYGLAIGASTADGRGSALLSEKGKIYEHSYVYNYAYDSSEPWHYITAIIDGDGTFYNTTKKTEDKVDRIAGKRISLIPKVSTAKGGLFIESVEVVVFDKAAIDGKYVVINIGDGTEAPVVELGNYNYRNEFGESIEYTSDGENYFTLKSDAIVTGKKDSNAGSTYTMEDGKQFPNGKNTNATSTFVDSGDAKYGKVMKIAATADYARVAYNVRFEVGSKYYITFDAKVEGTKTALLILSKYLDSGNNRYFIAGTDVNQMPMDKGGIAFYRNGKDISTVAGKMTTSQFSEGWSKYGLYIDTTSPEFTQNVKDCIVDGKFYLSIGVRYGNTTLYIDNFSVTKITNVNAPAPAEALSAVGSIRHEQVKTVDGAEQYVSAGLRFRGHISTAVKESAQQIGFVLAPSTGVIDDTSWYKFDETTDKLLSNVARSAVCYDKSNGTDVVYNTDEDGANYQLILTGLSKTDGRTAYNTRYTAVMYVKDTNGQYTYYLLGESSFNQIRASYRMLGFDEWCNY